jgi:hypothetical protein
MTPTAELSGSHLRTYQTIFQHPASHNLGWREVHSLFRHIARVEDEPNGNLRVTRHGQVIVLTPPRTKDVAGTDELLALRHFLERSETPAPGSDDETMHWLLVIDHHEARLYRSLLHGSVPQQILPHEADEYFRHEQNSANLSRGKEKPDPNSFFEPVAQALPPPAPVLVFGTGTGKSSEMDQFVTWARHHHPELAGRILGTVVVDEHHLTAGQLLAKAREFYLHHQAPVA